MLVRVGKKKYILRPGTKVQIDYKGVFSAAVEPNWTDAKVIDTLSCQFTCDIGDGTVVFQSYKNINETWRPVEESI